MINCSNCGKEISDDYRFCPFCGKESSNAENNVSNLVRESIVICDICGEETSNQKYCINCGAKLKGNEKTVSVKSNQRTAVNQSANKAKDKIPGKKELSAEKKRLRLNGTQLFFLIALLIAIGFIIMEFSGMFEEKKVVQQNSATKNSISLEELDEINNLETIVKNDTTALEKVLQLAHRLNDSGFFERATEYYKMYVRQNPENADVLVDLGVCYFELKQYDEAKRWMKRGLKTRPDHQIAHFNLGIVNLSAGYADSAKFWWNKTVLLNPSSEIGIRAKELLESH